MTLDELIAQMTNPQEFTRLCNSVFTDIYGDAFQVIDGTRGDNGNDGYVASERRVLAMYCPVKPEQKTDAGYMEKIKGDLAKAAALKRENMYEIETWSFVTPRKLADRVISAMRTIGADVGIRATHQESTFLANQLYQREHLLKGFPGLQVLDLAAKIDQLAQALAAKSETASHGSNAAPKHQPEVGDEARNVRLHQLTDGVPTAEGKSELKAIAYTTTDPILEINAILALLRWFDPGEDDRADLVAFASRGVERAKRSGLTDAEALFHANKAAMLAWDFGTALIEAHFVAVADLLVPFAITPIEQTQTRLTRLRELQESWKGEVSAAVELLKGSRDYEAIAAGLVLLGTTVGQVAHAYRSTKQNSSADRFLADCKALMMAAKDAYAVAGDELGAANAVFNLANQLRWHGGQREALDLVASTIPIAEKHRDLLLLQKAKWLLHTLETGDIPDYASGERRAWTVGPAS